ncbi:hypothetical protein Tsubulata_020472 [Turnera subulata]|uniref:DUF4283 domain-containing protein n=1 Tax=Turnera subulata TaxID=218843 RepID=A0A9Q0GFM0_9ROSI|nr:hypothetical protein Tsubulata_020472 [Turnera subulata]
MFSQPFLSQPMSHGLPGGLPPFQNPNSSQTNAIVNPPLLSLPPTNNLNTIALIKPKPLYFSRWNGMNGARYAFLRFKKDVPAETLILHITGTEIDGCSLVASMAKNRLASGTKSGHYQTFRGPRTDKAPLMDFVQNSKSFAVVVSNENKKAVTTPESSIPPREQAFTPKSASPKWLNKRALGVLKTPVPFSSLCALVLTALPQASKVIPLGGTSFLIKFLDYDDMLHAVDNKPEAIESFFVEFRPWRAGDTAFNRLCWVLIKVTPPHAWSAEFFKLIRTMRLVWLSLNMTLLTGLGLPISRRLPVMMAGGTSFLIKFLDYDDMLHAVDNKPESIESFFVEFRPWRAGDVAFNRLCWVLIKGTPPHAWSAEFFKVLSMKVGLMVDWSQESMSRDRLDVAEVLILTSSSKFINCVFLFSIADKNYEIGVVESQYDPLDWSWSSHQPQATGDDGGASSSHSMQSPVDEILSSSNRQRIHSKSTPHDTALSEENVLPLSEDPFNLRPVIQKLAPEHAPSHPSRLSTQSPKLIPSELSSILGAHQSSSQSVTPTPEPENPINPI